MSKITIVKRVLVFAAVLWATSVNALPTVFEYGVNVDGDAALLKSPSGTDPLPAGANISGYNETTGLGSILVEISSVGAHNVDAYFDYEFIDGGGFFFDELGSTFGTPAAGQSWEIDEPGFVFGDIFDHWEASALDDANALLGIPEDVSLGLGWDFNVALDEIASLLFSVSFVAPTSGFYIVQNDPQSDETIYFSSSLTIRQIPPNPVSLPSTFFLMLVAAGLGGLSRRSSPV